MRIRRSDETTLSAARQRAASFEASLNAYQRKRLGQFFTGLPLSRLLAALSVPESCRNAIDPMAGNGDLLDAVMERCSVPGYHLERVDAIEIDPATAAACRDRLEPWQGALLDIQVEIHANTAFNPKLIAKLPREGYDLVITNPPYVRYQTVARNDKGQVGDTADDIRQALLKVIDERVPRIERGIWERLVKAYSGLADLAVPAWLLSAMLVKPGGKLAVVAPATWRTRDYADVLQYMLLRFFSLEAIIADRQPGWFSEALVRTHLVVATRLPTSVASQPLQFVSRDLRLARWVEIEPSAKAEDSLVGAAFPGDDPEQAFVQWLFQESEDYTDRKGITAVTRPVNEEVSAVLSRCRSTSWLKRLEPTGAEMPLFELTVNSERNLVPRELRGILQCDRPNLVELDETGIKASQGLRTGCNSFFYVEWIEQIDDTQANVQVSSLFGGEQVILPLAALRPVLRRQSELMGFAKGKLPRGRVLDLRQFVLPEDFREVKEVLPLYDKLGQRHPAAMPKRLAELVRRAARTKHGKSHDGARIPELSAVRTNAQPARSPPKPQAPRFWYMLPDFVRRHTPDAFVARINQGTPWVMANRQPPILIDANFSTLWSNIRPWTPYGIVSLLNSTWARACMEAIGTPMGGGALKLEATHLRRLPVPNLTDDEIGRLAVLGKSLEIEAPRPSDVLDEIDHIVVHSLLRRQAADRFISAIIQRLCDYTRTAQHGRRRG